MPTFHTLEEAEKEFEKRFPNLQKKIETLHRPGTMHERYIETGRETISTEHMKSFLSLVWQSAQEARNRELVEKVGEISATCPERESDEYDDGREDMQNEVLSLINK